MISGLILQNLLHAGPEYWRRVLPYLKADYFDHPGQGLVLKTILAYVDEYNAQPTLDALTIELDRAIGADEDLAKAADEALNQINDFSGEVQETQWLLDKTEEFCQEQALNNALRKAILVLDGKEKIPKGALPKLLEEALGITFDTRIGHDYLADWEERWEEYHRDCVHIPFDIDYLNRITKGGLYKKTLTCWMAASGVGKSIVMCHMAAAHLCSGLNVMYVSCEMSEHRLAERIDMNMMDMTDDEVRALSKDQYRAKIEAIRKKTGNGKLFFKEYGAGSVTVAHIRALLNEAKRKQGFVPDVLYVDYLNIMNTDAVKKGENSYIKVKEIAQELRALAFEFDIPIVTATQVNRDGYENSDIDMTNTSESMGLVHTLDLFLAMMQPDDLASRNQILVKQLKNRYRDENRDRRFVLGLDKSKMRLYDVESDAQKGLNHDVVQPKKPENMSSRFAEKKASNKRDFSMFG